MDDDDCVRVCVLDVLMAVVHVLSLLTKEGGLDFMMKSTVCNLL